MARLPPQTLCRIVIQPDVDISAYAAFMQELQPYCTLQICPVDSSRVETLNEAQYVDVFEKCLDELGVVLQERDHIWELGNEVGGGSTDPTHLYKALQAYDWFNKNKLTKAKSLLTGYAVQGWEDYLAQVGARKFDYVFLSDYPNDGAYSPRKIDWKALSELFPIATIGVGECGITKREGIPENFIVATMKNFATLRSGLPQFQIPIHWWYGTQQFLNQGSLFHHFKQLVERLP